MIPAQGHVESDHRENDEDHEGDHFLDDLQLHEGERASVALEAHPVGRYLETVLEKSNTPREEDDKNERGGIGEETCLLQFQMPVPRQRHEDV